MTENMSPWISAGTASSKRSRDYAKDFRVTMYKPSLMLAHHGPGRHEYLFVKRALDADLLINLPKLKTHMKTGLTGALKNLVGICGRKESLPHHIRGSYFDGGDCYCTGNVFSRWADRLYDDWWENYAGMSVPERIAYSTATSHAQGGGAGHGRRHDLRRQLERQRDPLANDPRPQPRDLFRLQGPRGISSRSSMASSRARDRDP